MHILRLVIAGPMRSASHWPAGPPKCRLFACREEPGWRTLSTLFIVLVGAAWAAIYVLTIWQNGWAIENPNLNPLIGGSQAALMKLGAQVGGRMLAVRVMRVWASV